MLSETKTHIDSLEKTELLKMYANCEKDVIFHKKQGNYKLLDDRSIELVYIYSVICKK
jgi:hypothetical protein